MQKVTTMEAANGASKRKRLIIDTDPGVDDAMAILAAFNSPNLEIIGLTTIYGNVPTVLATENAIRLREMVGQAVPVVQGSLKSLRGMEKERIADFVHGKDGFGNSFLPAPKVLHCRILVQCMFAWLHPLTQIMPISRCTVCHAMYFWCQMIFVKCP